jgi:membrane peptidoglycan carboxypeptidase
MMKFLFKLIILVGILIGVAAYYKFDSVALLLNLKSIDKYQVDGGKLIENVNGKLVADYQQHQIKYVTIDEIPSYLRTGIVAVEDSRFFQHPALDPQGILRAVYNNIKTGEMAEGGSTITQQLAKNLFLSREKTMQRKAEEAVLAFQLENKYDKQEILEMYLNQIYFGSGVYGVANASHKYFNKDVRNLNLAECALLAGIPKSPNNFSPLNNPEKALKRRNLVLKLMANEGVITKKEAEQTVKLPLGITTKGDKKQ